MHKFFSYVSSGGVVGFVCVAIMWAIELTFPVRSAVAQTLITMLLYFFGMVLNYASHTYVVFQQQMVKRKSLYFAVLVVAGVATSVSSGCFYSLFSFLALPYPGVFGLFMGALTITPFSFVAVRTMFGQKSRSDSSGQ